MRGRDLYFCFRAHDDAPAACLVGFAHTAEAVDVGSGGEVGGFHVVHQFLDGDVRIVDVGDASVDDFAQVVCGHVGGHTDGDACSTVDEQAGDAGREDGRLGILVIVVRLEIDGVLVEVLHHFLAHLLQSGLGVTHGSGGVAIDTAEVTLTVDQRIAHGPVLSHAHQCAVDGAVAVGVVLTHHVAHRSGALAVALVGGVSLLQHTI